LIAYRRDVDGLRAVAVMSVVLFHFGVGGIPGGFTGVDIFFVISGYVIAGSLLTDLDKNRFSIVNFYWKRARRIIPAFTFVTLCSSVAAYFILLPSDLRDYARSLASSALFVSNIYFWKSTNYFSIDAQLRPLLHTWSLSVEEQYYIIAPFLFWFVYRFLGRSWTLVLAPLILISFVVSVYATSAAPTAGFYLLPTRMWELLLGALLVLRKPRALNSTLAMEAIGLAGAALLAVGIITIDESDPFPGINALYPCLGTALVIYAGQTHATRPTMVTRLLSTRLFVTIGLISYSLYLVHWPISAFVNYLTLSEPTGAMSALMTVVSLALAAFSWKFVEQPFRKEGPWLGPRPVLAGAAGALAVLCAIGYMGVAARGFPERFPDFAETKIKGFEDWRAGTCFNDGTNPLSRWSMEKCTRTEGYEERAMLWGDSFAAHYAPGLAANADKLKAGVLQYTYAGCPPMLSYFSYARPNCTIFNQRALDLVKAANVKTVILSARWTDYEVRGFEGLQETIEALNKLGVRVVVIGQSPQFAADIQKISYFAGRRQVAGDSWPMAMDAHVNDRLARYTKGATLINPLDYLCDGVVCRYRENGEYYYADYGHFSTAGSKHAIMQYWPALN
jgi:peptidoglycan/LPS O-acetylase OafA/YrhL